MSVSEGDEPVLSDALDRVRPLLDPMRVQHQGDDSRGYLDLLGDNPLHVRPGLPTSLVNYGWLPGIYDSLLRPLSWVVQGGPFAPSLAEERHRARQLLRLRPGTTLLDVACGPGNFAREFAADVGADGLVVGIDGSVPMLEQALRTTAATNVAYVLGDAVQLPFRDSSFDAVCCFAALYVFTDPFAALDDMARVLVPGGRIALLTSYRTRRRFFGTAERVGAAMAGIRLFGRDEITGALAERGFVEIQQHVTGLAQYVAARLP